MEQLIEYPEHYFIISTDGNAKVQFTFNFNEKAIITALVMVMLKNPEVKDVFKKALQTYQKQMQ